MNEKQQLQLNQGYIKPNETFTSNLNKNNELITANEIKEKSNEEYALLLKLENENVITNLEEFECIICYSNVQPGKGIRIRECLHEFCKECVKETIKQNFQIEINCPFRDDTYSCAGIFQQREIKSILDENLFESYLNFTLRYFELQTPTEIKYHCQKLECPGWWFRDGSVKEIKCPVCYSLNCINCVAIHTPIDCQTHIELKNSVNDPDGSNGFNTYESLKMLLVENTSMRCPACSILIIKTGGCDGVICSFCKTSICWATRGRRWGIKGVGDTSGGCRCKVFNNRPCHPNCGNCH